MTWPERRKVLKGRKEHSCSGCSVLILVGEPSTRWAGIWEGEFNTNRLCIPCDTFLYENFDMFEEGWSEGDIGQIRKERC